MKVLLFSKRFFHSVEGVPVGSCSNSRADFVRCTESSYRCSAGASLYQERRVRGGPYESAPMEEVRFLTNLFAHGVAVDLGPRSYRTSITDGREGRVRQPAF